MKFNIVIKYVKKKKVMQLLLIPLLPNLLEWYKYRETNFISGINLGRHMGGGGGETPKKPKKMGEKKTKKKKNKKDKKN